MASRQRQVAARRIAGWTAALPVAVTLAAVLLLAAPILAEESTSEAAVGSATWGLGQVVSDGTWLSGARVPSGTTLIADSLLETGLRPATVHLSGGQVLRLASHSSAFFQAVDGGVRMDVRSGQTTLGGSGAEPRTLSEDMFAFLSRDGRIETSGLAPIKGEQVASLASIDDDPPPVGTGVEVGAPTILGAERSCLPDVPYPVLDALIRPGPDVRVAKVYFRAAQHPHFYAVEMTGALDEFEAVLPAPSEGTDQVVYYVEAVSRSLESARTEEYTADVIGDLECQDKGGAGRYEGKKPGIVLIPTVPGSPLVPPGFQPLGLLAAGGGGLGGGAIAGIVGGVLGGLVLIDELDDDEPPASPVTP